MTDEEYLHIRRIEKIMRNPSGPTRDLVPKTCKECMYYQPDWKYRQCTFLKCHYGKKKAVFRKKPLSNDRYAVSAHDE